MTLTPKELAALHALINYNWDDELEDYQEHYLDGAAHIFESLVILDNVTRGINLSPQMYLGLANRSDAV